MYPDEDFYEYVPDEITLKINEIIKEELNSRLKFGIEELNRLRQSDKDKQTKIYELQREVKKIQQEYDQKLKTVLLEKEREVKRNIFQGFTMKDKVFFIDSKYIHEPCPTCIKGKIKVMINEKEEEVQCPHCNGQGEKHMWTVYVRKGEISQVDFKTWNAYDEFEKCTEVNFYINAADKGDSSKKTIDDIFKTEEEALKECELRNNKVK